MCPWRCKGSSARACRCQFRRSARRARLRTRSRRVSLWAVTRRLREHERDLARLRVRTAMSVPHTHSRRIAILGRPAARRRRGGALVAARRRLGTRHRHEPVRRLRLRQARRRLPRRSSRHYYTGTTHRARAAASTVRVLLQPNRSTVSFRGATQRGRPEPRRRTRPTRRRASGSSVVLRSATGRELERFAGRDAGRRAARTCACSGAADNGVARRPLPRQRSRSASPPAPGLNAINALGLESYVLGVVPQREPFLLAAPRRSRRRRSRRAPTRSRRTSAAAASTSTPTRAARCTAGYLSETPSTERARSPATRGQVVTYGGEPSSRPSSSRPPAATPRTSRTSSPAAARSRG